MDIRYQLKTTMDLRDMAAEPGEEFAGLDNAMLGQVKMLGRGIADESPGLP